MKKTVLFVMLLTMGSKVIGFLRDILLSYYYGVSGISDAYLIAILIPTVIFGLLAKAISTGYIPLFTRIEKNEGTAASSRFTNHVMNLLLVISTFLVLLGLVFTEALVKVFAAGFDGETLEIAVWFTRITIAGIYFTSIIRLLSAFLNVRKLFIVPTLIGLPMNAVLILSIIVSHETGYIVLLAAGNLFALFLQAVIIVYFAFKKGFRWQPVFKVRDPHLKQMTILALPIMLGTAVSQINKLVDRSLASYITEGGVSALYYANTLNAFILGVFVVSIATVMYPSISKMAAGNDHVRFKESVISGLNGVGLFVIPATIGAFLFAEPIVVLLFGRGAFDAEAVSMTSGAFFFYAAGLIGYGFREILSRAFYAMQDTKTPAVNAAIAVVINIILNFILSYFMGINGLALATSIAAFITTFLLYRQLRKHTGSLFTYEAVRSSVKILTASLIMGAVAYLMNRYLFNNLGHTTGILLTIIVAGVVYFGMILLFKVREAYNLLSLITKKRRT
ncbi:murein biosynthesis integral membrane protein MurJ [Jeotgalibacillus salarius]|uniref:Probable lipid II flippase MurJ n=1 Tax=Jeotgalibacillus salarius TaxID=546023 RepID=A0A4Y8LHK4_9BACL|nr:murein biosynthesis integral membrane protein MurJ [Jeotgalibacillus salarius]TFE01657.1 murein biosynthesis integral membrane protein MurJ [Jeotgalibacillus salarius]